MTKEQETFLAKFADEQIAKLTAEEARVAEVEAAREKEAAREQFIANLKATKEAEIAQAVAEFDSK